jgi:hypothetical protein
VNDHDTPTKPKTPLDEMLERFTHDLPSIPPPPELEDAATKVLKRLGVGGKDPSVSAVHDLAELQRQYLAAYKADLAARRKQDMWKQYAWPTASVIITILVLYVTMVIVQVFRPSLVIPNAIVGLVGLIATAAAGAAPALRKSLGDVEAQGDGK